MNKAFLAIASMIVTGFLIKSYKKLLEQPVIDKEELYHKMKKAEYERRRAEARPVVAKMDAFSTPRDGAKTVMSAIGTVQELREALRPCRPVDGCDAMAMAPGRFT